MLFLWIFGNNIEDSMGRPRFVAFYLLGGHRGAGRAGAHRPERDGADRSGASGAIAAVLGGYAVLYPRARVLTVVFIIIFFTVVQLPALLVLGLWFLLQLLPAFSEPVSGMGGGVAYFAHIGGFVFGLALIRLFADRARDDYDAHQPYTRVLMARTLALVGQPGAHRAAGGPHDQTWRSSRAWTCSWCCR